MNTHANKHILNVPNQLTTKGERAEYLYSRANNPEVETYDCAVPQGWVDKVHARLPKDTYPSDISRHVVTVYYTDKSVRIMPITDYGLNALCTLASYLNY